MILGAIIAGGRSRRFGSDKALAEIGGRALIDHVADALAAQTDALIVCGRDWPGLTSVPDRPAPDQGPLGGICAALRHAADNGFDAVLTAGCDTLPVPGDLVDLLLQSSPEQGGGPAKPVEGLAPGSPLHRRSGGPPPRASSGRIIEGQHMFGLWPAALADALERHLATQDDRTMRGWIALAGARSVRCDTAFHNLNTPEDFARYARTQGLAA